MQLGMVGLGRMGANMVRRLMDQGHQCVAFDVFADSVTKPRVRKARSARQHPGAISSRKLSTPRAVWLMVPGCAR